jgi:hypothetical protein
MRTFLLLLFVTFGTLQIQSQTKIISGIVSDDLGSLVGVNIRVKGETKVTVTDFYGKYSIEAQVGDILEYSFIGMKTESRTIGLSNIINVTMSDDQNVLEMVVVSGFGRKVEKRSSTFAVSSLSGKVSGVEITSGSIGSSSRIVLRGASSIKGISPQSGQLTAAELNDLEKWSEWLTVSSEGKFKKIQNDWGFNLKNKIEVLVKSRDGKIINNAKVSLYDRKRNLIMSVKSDVFGKAFLFSNSENSESKPYIVQVVKEKQVVGKRVVNNKILEFEVNNTVESNDIDIMFTIDATGSMSDEINYLKSELKNIINRIDNSIDKKRVALTFYRDIGDEYIVKDYDFNSDIDKVKNILSSQTANGGGDYEEAVEKALKVSMSKSWNEDAKSKMMFLLLDAPPHFNEENVRIIKNQIKIAQEKGIKIIPIVASDADKNVEFLMRFFSISTNGTYVFLTDDSGIGNSHLKPSTSSFKVEKLNDLIVRLIEKYSGVNQV